MVARLDHTSIHSTRERFRDARKEPFASGLSYLRKIPQFPAASQFHRRISAPPLGPRLLLSAGLTIKYLTRAIENYKMLTEIL
jgi:hypothetical protein